MYAIIERSQRFLDRPLGFGPRVLLLVSSVLVFPRHVGPLRGGTALAAASWVPFALGVLALLFLRACVHGKVRDLVDVTVISLYFGLFLLWSSPPGSDFYRLLVVALLMGGAFVMAWDRASLEDIAETQSAG
jgi:hypothetical protein